jgi:PAS domain S-box-containing protein
VESTSGEKPAPGDAGEVEPGAREVEDEELVPRAQILESITDAFFALDRDWCFTYVNAQAETLLQRTRDDLLGENIWDAFPEAVGSTFYHEYHQAVESDATTEFEEYYPPLDAWFEVKAFPFEDGLSVYFDDITDRHEAEQALRRERDLLEAVMSTSVAAIVVVDADTETIRYANRRAEQILGTATDAIEGRRFDSPDWNAMTFDGEPLPDDQYPYRRVMEAGTARSEMPMAVETPAGERVLLRVNGAPVSSEDDASFDLAVFSLNDVTERVRREEALKAAKNEAERASELKSTFLAHLSHDVRNPLSSIMGFAEMLKERVDEEHLRLVDVIETSSQRLLRTIDSVLDFSRLKTGDVSLDAEPTDLVALVRDTVQMIEPHADEKDLSLALRVPDQLRAETDPACFERIVDNLVSNAIKYTDTGRVTVRLRDAGDTVVLEVDDTGVGIDEDFLPDLFESFTQGASDRSGSGLGLAITKRLTEMMGGTIDVSSTEGVGTTFTVHLPREQPAASA